MSDNERTEKTDTRTVSIRAEIWHAPLEIIVGRQIDQENADISWRFGQVVELHFARSPRSEAEPALAGSSG